MPAFVALLAEELFVGGEQALVRHGGLVEAGIGIGRGGSRGGRDGRAFLLLALSLESGSSGGRRCGRSR